MLIIVIDYFLLQAMKLVGITLQDVDQGSAIVLTPTDDGQVHMVRNSISEYQQYKEFI